MHLFEQAHKSIIFGSINKYNCNDICGIKQTLSPNKKIFFFNNKETQINITGRITSIIYMYEQDMIWFTLKNNTVVYKYNFFDKKMEEHVNFKENIILESFNSDIIAKTSNKIYKNILENIITKNDQIRVKSINCDCNQRIIDVGLISFGFKDYIQIIKQDGDFIELHTKSEPEVLYLKKNCMEKKFIKKFFINYHIYQGFDKFSIPLLYNKDDETWCFWNYNSIQSDKMEEVIFSFFENNESDDYSSVVDINSDKIELDDKETIEKPVINNTIEDNQLVNQIPCVNDSCKNSLIVKINDKENIKPEKPIKRKTRIKKSSSHIHKKPGVTKTIDKKNNRKHMKLSKRNI